MANKNTTNNTTDTTETFQLGTAPYSALMRLVRLLMRLFGFVAIDDPLERYGFPRDIVYVVDEKCDKCDYKYNRQHTLNKPKKQTRPDSFGVGVGIVCDCSIFGYIYIPQQIYSPTDQTNKKHKCR
jgi:hypothetical protein